MDNDLPVDIWFWNAQYKFVWNREDFIEYYGVMIEVIQRLIQKHSSTPENATKLVSPEIGILRIPDADDSEKAKGFAVYIAGIRITEPNTTLFSWFKSSYRISVGSDDFSSFMFSESSIQEKHGDKADDIIKEIRRRRRLNRHFDSLADKSLNHRRKISSRLRYQILLRDKSRCQVCGRSAPTVKVHVDHKIPVSWDKEWEPSSNIDDYQILCEDCNLGKSDMSWIWYL